VITAAWEATLGVMIDAHAGALAPRVHRRIRLQDQALDQLLHSFLEEQLYLKDAEGLLLQLESCRVERKAEQWRVRGTARGEQADHRRHRLGTDVKAVTWHHFALVQEEGRWRATVVLDV
jgi:SHS2 domain-containing protein